jgi:hypothetical protein
MPLRASEILGVMPNGTLNQVAIRLESVQVPAATADIPWFLCAASQVQPRPRRGVEKCEKRKVAELKLAERKLARRKASGGRGRPERAKRGADDGGLRPRGLRHGGRADQPIARESAFPIQGAEGFLCDGLPSSRAQNDTFASYLKIENLGDNDLEIELRRSAQRSARRPGSNLRFGDSRQRQQQGCGTHQPIECP